MESGKDLPTLPVVVLQLHNILDDERAGSDAVAEVIQRDPALTARVLRAANSAAHATGGSPIGSVMTAVQRLGVNQVRSICVVLAVVRAFSGRSRNLDHQRLWMHSAVVGFLARRLWDRFGASDSVSADDAYVAGLLHDCGLLILDQYFPRDLADARRLQAEAALPLWQCEEDIIGMDHGAVAGLLLGRWSLPPAISEAVSCHHHPDEAAAELRTLARVLFAAEVLGSGELTRLEQEGPADTTPEEALSALGASPPEIETIKEEVPRIVPWAKGILG